MPRIQTCRSSSRCRPRLRSAAHRSHLQARAGLGDRPVGARPGPSSRGESGRHRLEIRGPRPRFAARPLVGDPLPGCLNAYHHLTREKGRPMEDIEARSEEYDGPAVAGSSATFQSLAHMFRRGRGLYDASRCPDRPGSRRGGRRASGRRPEPGLPGRLESHRGCPTSGLNGAG